LRVSEVEGWLMKYLGIGMLVFSLAACEWGTNPPSTETYNLTSVNGRPLPYVLAESGQERLEVSKGSVQLVADGQFTRALTLTQITPDDPTGRFDEGTLWAINHPYFEAGTWVREGSTLRVAVGGHDQLLGVTEEGSLTITENVPGIESKRIPRADYRLSLDFHRR
jgi:hypothetical protein